MKKQSLIIVLFIAGIVLNFSLCSFAAPETVTGKLAYYEYDAYPYVVEVKPGEVVALYLDVDKTNHNHSVDKLVGKTVRVAGPAKVITADTELRGLKIIDVRPGNGFLKVLK